MELSLEALRGHVAYAAWATERLLEAASQLSSEELTRDFQTADQSVMGTFGHLFAAERTWLARLQGEAASPAAEKEWSLAVLKSDWLALYAQWDEWLGGLDEKAPDMEISYTDKRGNPGRQPLWQLVLHVVNHGTHHRGQVSGFIRTMGYTPPSLDLLAYYRRPAAH